MVSGPFTLDVTSLNNSFVEVADIAQRDASLAAKEETPLSPQLNPSRRIRFMDPTEADIHVYESHPSSPKRVLALLPPPPTHDRSEISSPGTSKGSMNHQNPSSFPSSMHGDDLDSPEEGTPEYIRREFFPSEMSAEDIPALAWMLPPVASSSKSTPHVDADDSEAKHSADMPPIEARYSLSGVRLSPTQIRDLPTHLGLHHHASRSSSIDTPAGYTLSDLLLLARSSVPAQRASVLGVLAKILQVSREGAGKGGLKADLDAQSSEQVVDMGTLRRDVLDAAIDALHEKGGVGQRAVDLLWEAVVGFTYTDFDIRDLYKLPFVDLTPVPLSQPSSSAPLSGREDRIITKFSRHSSAILVAIPLDRVLPALKNHLVTSPSPRSLTHSRVLDILFVLSHFSQHARMIVNPDVGIIAAMMGPHLQSTLDSDSEERQSQATLASIRVLQVLTRSGRDIAATLTGPADVLLRYVTTPLPPLDLSQLPSKGLPAPLGLLTETLIFYSLLVQYGIYANIATVAQNEFAHIGTWLSTTFRVFAEPAIASLARAYLNLLEALIVCSTDPHNTTPSHDILWSQVRGWGWIEWTLDFTDALAAVSEPMILPLPIGQDISQLHKGQPLWTSVFNTLAVCVECASVNGIKRGELERTMVSNRIRSLFESACVAELIVLHATTTLQVWRLPSSSALSPTETLHKLASAASLVAAATRLALACLYPGGEQSFKLPDQVIHDVCIRFLENEGTRELFNLVSGYRDTMEMPEDAHTFVRPISSLLSFELQLRYRLVAFSTTAVTTDATILRREWVTQALQVLHTLLPGDEHHVKWIFESLCHNIDSKFVEAVLSTSLPQTQWENGGMRSLLPFLTRSLRPVIATGDQDHPWHEATYVAPSSPTPESIARCTTLLLPSLSHLRNAWILYDHDLVLPLRSEWPTWPLNHLLHSGTSPVFRELPADWNATETDVVRVSLLLARIVQELCTKRTSHVASASMSRAETIFACMKVFMLEHEQRQLDSGEEVFRDQLVTRWMDELLTPFTIANPHGTQHSTVKCGSSLEQVSRTFLSMPFYQFYTDFLALYDAISFSQPLFGRLLLPPISMAYTIDYRKLLFGDFAHAMRTIKTSIGDVICEDVQEYLWPVEKDVEMVGWYMKALLATPGSEFIRWIAIHHLAANIWPDFKDGHTSDPEWAVKLLSTIVKQASFDVTRDVALYHQLRDEVCMPPKCYERMGGTWVEQRLDIVQRVGDQAVKERLHGLFLQET